MTMITPSYLGETIEYSSLHACRSTLEDPTHVRPKSASQPSKTGPKSANTMSSSVISRSGGSTVYGCNVFGPDRTIRLCQCRSTPNRSAASSDTARLASLSDTPGRKIPSAPTALNSSSAACCASKSRATRTPSSSSTGQSTANFTAAAFATGVIDKPESSRRRPQIPPTNPDGSRVYMYRRPGRAVVNPNGRDPAHQLYGTRPERARKCHGRSALHVRRWAHWLRSAAAAAPDSGTGIPCRMRAGTHE